MLLLMSNDYMRGFVPRLASSVNIWPMIRFDEYLCGGAVPTVMLQSLLHTPGRIRWFDVYLAAAYFTHFIVPLLVAFGFGW